MNESDLRRMMETLRKDDPLEIAMLADALEEAGRLGEAELWRSCRGMITVDRTIRDKRWVFGNATGLAKTTGTFVSILPYHQASTHHRRFRPRGLGESIADVVRDLDAVQPFDDSSSWHIDVVRDGTLLFRRRLIVDRIEENVLRFVLFNDVTDKILEVWKRSGD